MPCSGGIAAAALERRLDPAEAGGEGEDGDGVDERVGACGAAAHAEGEHEPGSEWPPIALVSMPQPRARSSASTHDARQDGRAPWLV
jgi:hypothetical protein